MAWPFLRTSEAALVAIDEKQVVMHSGEFRERLDFITLAKHLGYRAGCCPVVRQGHEARAKQPRAAFDVSADNLREGITASIIISHVAFVIPT
ncbi:MAG: hypothetical protein LAO30_17975 [Acidobacteriia bacterium]|nr:hypothetical protein [Terriglobia bacterium]